MIEHRARSLRISAYSLRQHAINGGSDIQAWRLARRMREANTVHQLSAVERELEVYMRRNPSYLPAAA